MAIARILPTALLGVSFAISARLGAHAAAGGDGARSGVAGGRLASDAGARPIEIRSCLLASGHDCGTSLVQRKQATSRVAFAAADDEEEEDGLGDGAADAAFGAGLRNASSSSSSKSAAAGGGAEAAASDFPLEVDCLCRKGTTYWCPGKFISLLRCNQNCARKCGEVGFMLEGCHNWRTLGWYRRLLRPPRWQLRFCDAVGPTSPAVVGEA